METPRITGQFRHCSSAFVSLSVYATVNLTDFRNGYVAPEEGAALELEPIESPKAVELWKRVTAEIGYALLLVVSIVEAVARALLMVVAIPVLFIMDCLWCTSDKMRLVANITSGGFLLTTENIAKLTVLLFTNLCEEEEIVYDHHFPDFKPCNDCIGHYVNDFFGGKLHNPPKPTEGQQPETAEGKA
jgi:hypothetical protein